jgi:hypothetical protein
MIWDIKKFSMGLETFLLSAEEYRGHEGEHQQWVLALDAN